MRLFKAHRSQGSLSNSPDGSPRDPSPVGPPPQYHHQYSRQQFDGPGDHSNLIPARPPHPGEHPQHPVDRKYEPVENYATQSQPALNITAATPIQGNTGQPTIEEAQYSQVSPTTTDKEPARSKRSYFGIRSSQKEPESNTPKTLGRSVSVRKRLPPQPAIDTSSVSRRLPQIQSAVEPPPNREEPFLRPQSLGHNPIPSPNVDQESVNDHSTSAQYRQSQDSLGYPSKAGSDRQQNSAESLYQEEQDLVTPNQNTYNNYHASRSSDNGSLQSYDLYRNRPVSQHSFGPPSPIPSQPALAVSRDPHAAYSPIQQDQLHGQDQGNMARDGQNLGSRQSVHPSHSHVLDKEQYSQIPSGMSQQKSIQLGQGETGRSTPPPSSKGDLSSLDLGTLIQKHEELQAKYSKVKKYYFEKEAQVNKLQDTVAHQRLSMSNTALDDNEYQTRFNRLDGAINNLAFNIRKDWRAIPPWLQPVVNKEAASVGTKEMTAVGRACITRWLVDELFDRHFHPGLDPGLSSQLKIIEKNIRRSSLAQTQGDAAQKEDASTKLSNWRLTTVEGLQETLSSSHAQDNRSHMTSSLVEKLTASLQMNLNDPPPPGLDSSIGMIVEIAVGISANIPMESRDVSIDYFMPNAYITDTYMRIETTLPPLSNPGSSNDNLDQADQASTKSAGTESEYSPESDRDRDFSGGNIPPRGDSLVGGGATSKADKKKSIFGGLVNKKPTPAEMMSSGQRTGSSAGLTGGATAAQKEKEEAERMASDRERRIRFAAFVAVEVRGRGQKDAGGNILVKAPCFGF